MTRIYGFIDKSRQKEVVRDATTKNYTGSVYGGLGHLLKAYCEANELTIPEQLEQIQNLERFDYVVWRDLLEVIYKLDPKPGLG